MLGLPTEAGDSAPGFRIEVEGASMDLAPLVRDEVYRIAVEALRNAFRHAQAKRIEVEIHYDKRQLGMRVRDNGKGIDQEVLDAGGLSGHHGLPGIRERSALVKGKLSVWSEANCGTEVELTVPASVGYVKASVASHSPQ
jgi:signal transduction histidine kinase